MSDKVRLSVPRSKKVCGYEIRKMPIGRYIEAMDEISAFPREFIGTCFPDTEFKDIVERLSRFDEKMLQACVTNVFTIAPRYALEFVARLTDIESERLLNDENIGLDGLVDIINTFIEVNDLGKFVESLIQARFRLRKAQTDRTLGFKDLLRQG